MTERPTDLMVILPNNRFIRGELLNTCETVEATSLNFRITQGSPTKNPNGLFPVKDILRPYDVLEDGIWSGKN